MEKYPSCRYHPEHGTALVHDEEEDKILTPGSEGWCDTPASFGKPSPEKEEAPAEPEEVTPEPESEGVTEEAEPGRSESFGFGGEFGDGDGEAA